MLILKSKQNLSIHTYVKASLRHRNYINMDCIKIRLPFINTRNYINTPELMDYIHMYKCKIWYYELSNANFGITIKYASENFEPNCKLMTK